MTMIALLLAAVLADLGGAPDPSPREENEESNDPYADDADLLG